MRCDNYNKLTLKSIIELAAPHTWAASIMPVILGSALSFVLHGKFSAGIFYSVLLTSIFLQCAVNTINDYADFVKGTDREENSDDPTDASIVYNGINPRDALLIGIGFIVFAGLCGLYALIFAGWELLIFGAVGVGVIILYSLGKKPISYLPLGEITSGVVMGGIITIAVFYAMTGELNLRVVYYSLPLIFTIGMIMFTNNISDIERDAESGRKTLPVLTGRHGSVSLHLIGTIIETLIALVIIYLDFTSGIIFAPILILLVFFPEIRIIKGKLVPDVRVMSMRGIIQIHWRLNIMYTFMLTADFILKNYS